jgi:putrescine transport system permease protein
VSTTQTSTPENTAQAAGDPRRFGIHGRYWVVAAPYIWLLIFFLAPFVLVLKISFSSALIAQPPYTEIFDFGSGWIPAIKGTLSSYEFLLSDELYIVAYLNSIKIATISTVLCLLIGYPMAYGIARAPGTWRNALLMLVILPFWTSFLIRVYAWIGILKNNGILNNALMGLGIIDEPLQMLHSDFSVYVGIVYSYLPFMILPLYANLAKMDESLLEAASDLGCRPWKAFASITLPLSIPGIVAGSMLVFIPAVGEFVIPELLGGPDTLMIGKILWNEFFRNRDWPVASAVAIAMLILLVIPIVIFQHFQAKEDEDS